MNQTLETTLNRRTVRFLNPGLNDPKIMAKLRLPEQYAPYGCVCVGYPDGEIPGPKKRKAGDADLIR